MILEAMVDNGVQRYEIYVEFHHIIKKLHPVKNVVIKSNPMYKIPKKLSDRLIIT